MGPGPPSLTAKVAGVSRPGAGRGPPPSGPAVLPRVRFQSSLVTRSPPTVAPCAWGPAEPTAGQGTDCAWYMSPHARALVPNLGEFRNTWPGWPTVPRGEEEKVPGAEPSADHSAGQEGLLPPTDEEAESGCAGALGTQSKMKEEAEVEGRREAQKAGPLPPALRGVTASSQHPAPVHTHPCATLPPARSLGPLSNKPHIVPSWPGWKDWLFPRPAGLLTSSCRPFTLAGPGQPGEEGAKGGLGMSPPPGLCLQPCPCLVHLGSPGPSCLPWEALSAL